MCNGEKEARSLVPAVPQGKVPCLLKLTWNLQGEEAVSIWNWTVLYVDGV